MVAASTMNLTEGNRFPLCFQLFFSPTVDLKVLVALSFTLIHNAMTVT